MAEITHKQADFLRLLLRSPDCGDGWRKVSTMCWFLVRNFPHQELIETKDENMVRLSESGKTVVEYLI